VQRYLIGDRAGWLAVIDYGEANPCTLGTALGLGAMLGELPNSFVKRRLGIAPGGCAHGIPGPVFYLWDQVDFLTTTWPPLLFWVRPGWMSPNPQ
ncbi:MAG: CDP-archaeol synthase, partial [Candidatus Methylomirabilales bacterium]